MPTIYSSNYSTGRYTYTRVRVDYSGTTATAILLYSRTNNYSGPTNTGSPATFTVTNKGSVSIANKTFYGFQSDAELGRVTFSISMAGETIHAETGGNTGQYLSFSGDITIPAQNTPPTGLARTNTTINPESISATVSVTGWGNGGSTAGHYVELSVCAAQNTTTRNYTKVYPGNSLSGSVTVDNSASTTVRQLTITPNTRYYLTQYATNGASGTGNSSFETAVTPCLPPATFEVVPGSITDTTATLRWAPNTNSGHYMREALLYNHDGSWHLAEDLQDIELTGLTPDSSQYVIAKVIGYWTNPEYYVTESEPVDITFTTKKSHKGYGSVNGEATEISKIYGSVNNQTKEIVAIYGSDNGVTKRIY